MTTINAAVDDLFNNQRLPLAAAVDRHFSPTYRQRTNGNWDDRPTFLARIAELRKVVERAAITVLDELADGSRYAEHHVVELLQRDGDQIRQEVFVFAERDSEGRFVRIEEATRMLEDGEAPDAG